MSKTLLDELQYYILPSANPSDDLKEIHNKTFDLWHGVWTNVFNELKFDTSNLEDDFIRQNLIVAICHKNIPVAVHLYSFFSMESKAARSHRYLKQFPETYFEKLKRFHVNTMMSLEYMTVHPEWRKGKVPVHIGSVLMGLSCKVLQHYKQDASIAPARRDHKVHEVVYSVGGEPIISNVINHNVPCDLLAIRKEKVKSHDSAEVQNTIERLWATRVECQNIFVPAYFETNKQAA